ncbi:MAG: nicotinate-nicotinamide nucleotide adenylyltransferase [Proteobacteria bacterium]|nr:nicotinate-nicotinamide nucleotide adenylyltransferase [Pseudomonadota bacterium]
MPRLFQLPKMLVYGGSFDPCHLGHMKIVSVLDQLFTDSRIVIMPSFQSSSYITNGLTENQQATFKQHQFSFNTRVTLLQLSLRDQVLSDRVAVSHLEQRLGGVSITWHTVERLRHMYGLGAGELSWVIGQDQLLHFHTWDYPEDLLEWVTLCVYPRGQQTGAPSVDNGQSVLLTDLKSCLDNLNFEVTGIHRDKHHGDSQTMGFDVAEIASRVSRPKKNLSHVILMEGQLMNISSTVIRELLASNPRHPDMRNYVTQSVYDFLKNI